MKKKSLLNLNKNNIENYRLDLKRNNINRTQNSYGWVKGEYKNNLITRQLIKKLYKLSGKDYKKLWKILRKNNRILTHLETRIDVLMVRGGLTVSLEHSRKLIKEGKVLYTHYQNDSINNEGIDREWKRAGSYNVYLKKGESLKIAGDISKNMNILLSIIKKAYLCQANKESRHIKIWTDINSITGNTEIVLSLLHTPGIEELRLPWNLWPGLMSEVK